jgi:heme-degrading monooxygenase HmoA
MIRVLIDRVIAQGMEGELRSIELEARKQAVQIPGYISGESLCDTADSQHHLVISTWRSREDWERWLASDRRNTLTARISPLLKQPETITVCEPL